MIAKDSISYPCLGVAQHFNLDYGDVLEAGRRMLEYFTGKTYIDWRTFRPKGVPVPALAQLRDNYYRAAKHFNWRPHVD
jgi:hypothetical protein